MEILGYVISIFEAARMTVMFAPMLSMLFIGQDARAAAHQGDGWDDPRDRRTADLGTGWDVPCDVVGPRSADHVYSCPDLHRHREARDGSLGQREDARGHR